MRTVTAIVGFIVQPGTNAAIPMNSSSELVERLRQGEDEAFRVILERYARPILSFIFDIVGEGPLAEELTQETFVRAYKNINRLQDAAKFTVWLFGIAKNVAREALYTRRRQERIVDIDDFELSELGDGRPLPDGQLLNKELDQVIREALASLDEDKRLVFTLRVLQQRSYNEIAEITGFSITKLRTDLHRAKIKMRRQIRPYLRGER